MVVGPHWPFALVFTGGMVLFFPITVVAVFWNTVPKWASVVLLALSGVSLALLMWLGCSDPGIARRISGPNSVFNLCVCGGGALAGCCTRVRVVCFIY